MAIAGQLKVVTNCPVLYSPATSFQLLQISPQVDPATELKFTMPHLAIFQPVRHQKGKMD
jgi:hypothetical protein